MSIEIRNAPTTALGDHACISIAFEVRTVLDVEVQDRGLGGFRLVERSVTEPWIKDYDECDEGPTGWAKRFDISNWGLVSAWRHRGPERRQEGDKRWRASYLRETAAA